MKSPLRYKVLHCGLNFSNLHLIPYRPHDKQPNLSQLHKPETAAIPSRDCVACSTVNLKENWMPFEEVSPNLRVVRDRMSGRSIFYPDLDISLMLRPSLFHGEMFGMQDQAISETEVRMLVGHIYLKVANPRFTHTNHPYTKKQSCTDASWFFPP